uniref:Carcinoma-related EF-hand protein n=1 Tax=Rousettus aegyptiacus TaxID=9407 RepID=A0A7J8K5J6_ROUAE|nr:carcinoma-related EF-hand protein [Rousettus aegyptiacus]
MSSVWKNPCAADAMPEMVVKIIGSKHFQYLVEKPKIKNENVKAETQRVLQKSVTGNARQMSKDPPAPNSPSDHQINHDPDDVEDSKHQENNQKPENQKLQMGALSSRFLDGKIPNQVNVHCISVPTGDQSLSYIHGLPRRNLRDWSLEQMARGGSDQPEDIGQRPTGMTKEDTFLLALVRREVESCSLSSGLLDTLEKELKILDPTYSGFLLQSQLSRLFLRHEVPLQLPTIKILCQRFSRRSSPEMVNYGKLLRFLKVAASDDPQQSKQVVDSNLKKTEGGSHHSKSDTAPPNSNLQSEMKKSLLEILKMALRTTNGKLNIENLNLSFRKEDHSFSGYLSPPKVRAICGKHGLYLTLSLLETLLTHQDLGYQGEIKWQNFVELLSRASFDLSSDLPVDPEKNGKEISATEVQPEVPEMSQSKTKHMKKTPEEELQPENLPAETSAPKDPLSSLAIIRPVSQPFISPMMKNKSEECETWIDRFRKLENALYLCDLSNKGVLEKERARRLIHNYNLIYNLSLSPWKIDQALRRFRSGENMLLEPALRYLKEL